jgi:Phosphotransferase system mannitol/fructose-specific IIA domain (Ntr-type)
MVAATVEKGLDFESFDGEPVYLIILIVSPGNTVGPHLKALSSVSRLLADGTVRKDLIESKTPSEFLTILRAAEDKFL